LTVTERVHRSIGEVLAELQDDFPDVTISKIRFLESQGLIDPERTPSGYRKFYDDDVDRLQWILARQRDQFLPLKVIKSQLEDGTFERESRDGVEDGAPIALWADAGAAPDEVPVADHDEAAPPRVAERDPFEHDAILSSIRASANAHRPPDPVRRAAVEDAPASPPPPLDPRLLDGEPGGANLSVDELCRASGLTAVELAALERYGLLRSRMVGPAAYYDAESLAVAKLSAAFLRHGVEARHLRMYKTAAEREAGLFEQVVLPLVKQGRPDTRRAARDQLVEMARLGEALRAAMLRLALRDLT
jgi:DNA-binding transcriptional MerR regulator